MAPHASATGADTAAPGSASTTALASGQAATAATPFVARRRRPARQPGDFAAPRTPATAAPVAPAVPAAVAPALRANTAPAPEPSAAPTAPTPAALSRVEREVASLAKATGVEVPAAAPARPRGAGIAAAAARIAERRREAEAEARRNARRKNPQTPPPPAPVGPTAPGGHLALIGDLVATWDDLQHCATLTNEAYALLQPHQRPLLAYVVLRYDPLDARIYGATFLDTAAVEIAYGHLGERPLQRGCIPLDITLDRDHPWYDAVTAHADQHLLVIDVAALRAIDWEGAQEALHTSIRTITAAAASKKIG